MDHEKDFWTPGRFAQITRGRWLVLPGAGATLVPQGVNIDSRAIQRGQVFVAIKGENHDGHDHVPQAIERGAGLVIVQRDVLTGCHGSARLGEQTRAEDTSASGSSARVCSPSLADPWHPEYGQPEQSAIRNPQSAILLVPDTVLALQQLAFAWRDELTRAGVKVIAVTGSNGKTTTRHLIHAALSATLRGTQSPRSFNNHLGVPLTLLATPLDADFVVAEVGTNHVGEIETLAKILRPDAAVITTIGTAHIGHFGSREAIAAEKSSLFKHVRTPTPGLGPSGPSPALAVVRGDEPFAQTWRTDVIPAGIQTITFGRSEMCDVRTEGTIRSDAAGVHFSVVSMDGPVAFTLPFLGEHNVTNALAAIAVARWCGVPDAASANALRSTRGVEMRMQLIHVGPREGASGEHDAGDSCVEGTPAQGGITILNDAYNANPDSMSAALRTLASLPLPAPHSRRVAILGDMYELGDEGLSEHARMGRLIHELNRSEPRIHMTILIGKLMQPAAKELHLAGGKDSLVYFETWSDDLPCRIAQLLRCDDLVLLKASRGLRLERLVPSIEQRFTSTPAPAGRP